MGPNAGSVRPPTWHDRPVPQDRWVQTYDLREDAEAVRLVQEASLHKPGFGFPPEPFLYGTPEWWSAIAEGTIESRLITGVIASVFWGSMGDWAEFTVQDANGDETTWTRKGDLTRYVEGQRVRLHCAKLDYKPDAPFPGVAEVVLGIWLEPSDARTPLYKGYRGSREPEPEDLRHTHSFPLDGPQP
jgi:hypothetical protein